MGNQIIGNFLILELYALIVTANFLRIKVGIVETAQESLMLR